MPERLWPWTLALTLASCGGSAYDVEYDCEQTIACQRERGEAPGDQAACVRVTEALVDELTKAQAVQLEATFLKCESKTSCAYVTCATAGAALTAQGSARAGSPEVAGALLQRRF